MPAEAPPVDLTTAVFDAVNIALQLTGLDPLDQLLSLFSGRPKFEDSNDLIAGLKLSAYWPLHALAADLQIAVNNGAPISDSNPAVQATFRAWKHGTVLSLQGLAHQFQGETGQGYWTLTNLIDKAWEYSKDGVDGVLRFVKAIDQLTIALSQHPDPNPFPGPTPQPPPPPPPKPPPPPPPPPPPGASLCEPLDPEQDEILASCIATQTSLGRIIQLLEHQVGAPPPKGIDPCCAAVVHAIAGVTTQLSGIASALSSGNNAIDLTPLTAQLGDLVAAVNGYPPAAKACCDAIAGKLDAIASAIANLSNPAGVDLSAVVEQLRRRNDDLQVPADWKDQLIRSGAVPDELVPLLQSTTWETVGASGAHFLGYVLGVGLHEAGAIVERIFSVIFKPLAGVIWKLLTELVAGFDLGAGDTPHQIATVAKKIVAALDAAITTIFGGAANLVLEGYESGILGIDTTTDAGVSQVVQILMGRALELGMGAHLLATLPELAYFTKNLGLNTTAALLAELAGFHEIMIQAHRPFMTAALGRPASYTTNRKFPNTLPAAPAAMQWWARRKLGDADAAYLASSGGFNTKWQAPMFAAAYRPMSPRALASAIQDAPFPRDQMQEILEDNGYSPTHVHFLLDLFEYASTKNLRNTYINEAIAAYKAGIMPDAELDDILGSVGWSDQAKQFVRSRALLQRREVLAKEAEKQIVPQVANGVITPDTGLQQLEAAGVEPWYAELQVRLAEVRASVAAAKLEARAEARLEIQRQRNLTRAAIAEFQRGVIDLPGLTAALAAIGLDSTLVASIVAVQDATRTGRLKFVYGQLLSPQDAAVLRDQVAAIGQQAKDQLLTLDQAEAQLLALKVDQPEAKALIARWAAALKKSPGASQLVTP